MAPLPVDGPRFGSMKRRMPGQMLALFVVAVALLTHLAPWLTETLQLSRDAAWLQPWRLLGGHLTHWNGAHLALNAAGLLLCARLSGARAPAPGWSLAGMLACSLLMVGAMPDIRVYRGASALVAIYLPSAALGLWLRGGTARVVAALLAGLYLLRLAADALAMMPSPLLPPGVRSTWEMHLLGLAWGSAGLVLAQRSRSSRPSS